jgi:DNA invertase Pin-like site-specific DNA recombinase
VGWQLDWLAWFLRQLIQTVEDLEGRGIGLKSITKAIDTSTPSVRLVFHSTAAIRPWPRKPP